MKKPIVRSDWSILFCDLCHEPTIPDQLVKISGYRVCKSCSLDRFPQPITADYSTYLV